METLNLCDTAKLETISLASSLKFVRKFETTSLAFSLKFSITEWKKQGGA
jgi:hypothetical protein